ncbi:unnamed protein product [Effrenium voratum]|nr:unnamed protein product [Effrenium voratum]
MQAAQHPPWEAPAWSKSGESGRSAPSRTTSAEDANAKLQHAARLLRAAFTGDQVAAMASAPPWHFATSASSVRAMAGPVGVNHDAQCLRTALEALGSDGLEGQTLRHCLGAAHLRGDTAHVDFRSLQAELGAFVAAVASLNPANSPRKAVQRQSPRAVPEGIMSAGGLAEGRVRHKMGTQGNQRAVPSRPRPVLEGVSSAGGRPSIPGLVKAQQISCPPTPEETSPMSSSCADHCLSTPTALTRRKERSEPSPSKPKKPASGDVHAREAGRIMDGSSQSDAASPPSEDASTAVPQSSYTSEGACTPSVPFSPPSRFRPVSGAAALPSGSRAGSKEPQAAYRGPPAESRTPRWQDVQMASAARRREQSAEATCGQRAARTPRPGAHVRTPSNPSAVRLAEEVNKGHVLIKRDRDSVMKTAAAHFHASPGQPVNSLEFYAVGRLLGKGAFGKVNVAVHKVTEELSAMKQCDRRRMTEVGNKKSLMQEVAIMKRLTSHANIIQLFEVIETASQIVLMMEFATGGDLLRYVRNRRRLAEPCAKDLFKQLMEGLEHVHEMHVVHRDIKLENLLLDPFGCVKIADFGVAAIVQPGKKLHDHCGTPSYIAPEILQDAGYEGFPVDVWSAGVALYAMLCGRLPFKGKSMSELKRYILRGKFQCPSHLSPAGEELIGSMLTMEPRSRATIKRVLSHSFLEGIANRAKQIYGCLLCPMHPEDGKPEGCVNLAQSAPTRAVLQKVMDFGFPSASTEESLTLGRFDHATAMFHLVAQQVMRRRVEAQDFRPEAGDPARLHPDAGRADEGEEELDGGGTDDVSTLIRAAPC